MGPITAAALLSRTGIVNTDFSAIHWDPVRNVSGQLDLYVVCAIPDRRKVRLFSAQ